MKLLKKQIEKHYQPKDSRGFLQLLKKLNRRYDDREATMKLTQMQDIAGCRVVMSNAKLAKSLYQDYYIKGDLKHKK